MKLLNLLYPPRCPFCGGILKEPGVCGQCLKNTTELTATVCRVCGAYPENCHCGNKAFAFRRNVSAFTYEGAPRNLLLRFKQRNRPQLGAFMAKRMYHHIRARLGEAFDAIVFVPQSLRRSMERGYCPAKLLAEDLAKRFDCPCADVLQRIGGVQQKYLSSADRWANAKESYSLKKNACVGGRVLLIDDLFTTGATLNACAELLRKAGAEEVVCATFAITVKKS